MVSSRRGVRNMGDLFSFVQTLFFWRTIVFRHYGVRATVVLAHGPSRRRTMTLWSAFCVMKAGNGARSCYYAYSSRFKKLRKCLLFRFRDKMLATLIYFGLFKLALCVSTDPILTNLSLHRCAKVDWKMTFVPNGFESHDLQTSGDIDLKKETVQFRKCMPVGDDATASVTLLALPVYLCASVLRLTV